jgi:hypothetical protein
VYQYRKADFPRLSVKPERISTADQLNGVQWRFATSWHAGAYSYMSFNNRRWSEWLSMEDKDISTSESLRSIGDGAGTMAGLLKFSIEEKHGHWTMQISVFSMLASGGEAFVNVDPDRLAAAKLSCEVVNSNPFASEDAAIRSENERLRREKEQADISARKLKDDADERRRLAKEAEDKAEAAASEVRRQKNIARGAAATAALKAAEVTLTAAEFEPRLQEAVRIRVGKVFGTNSSQYQDAIRRVSGLVHTCLGISATQFAGAFITTSPVPRLWPLDGGKFGYCEQYYVRTARMRNGIPPGQTPQVPNGPGLIFYDTLRMNWRAGSWTGPKFRIEVYLDSPEYYNIPGMPEATEKYIVMVANVIE